MHCKHSPTVCTLLAKAKLSTQLHQISFVWCCRFFVACQGQLHPTPDRQGLALVRPAQGLTRSPVANSYKITQAVCQSPKYYQIRHNDFSSKKTPIFSNPRFSAPKSK
ncbi:unnamed protein product [Ixodes pacificus]